MWSEVKNHTKIVFRGGNTSEGAVPIHPWVHSTKQHSNGSQSSTANPPPSHMDPLARGSGIIPGAIAAAVFIGFILALYTVLWKCMVSPPQRLRKRVRV
ncbi:uncharacterized protein sb:cb288 isoform X2 [Esox lucius]|uniref:uncharacterized protein sb:cb288 isoform X2 n=1 Tax=Esox lucius TaxID=8010 RepID=UPI0014778453|nr:uncharacterized protein sb:cb288 isoform X2 [Esox lucius]